MQEVLRVPRASEGPVVLVSPLVRAHDENPDRLAREPILDPFEQVIVPTQGRLVLVNDRRLTEVDVANRRAVPGVAADDDEEALAAASGVSAAVRLDPDVVAQRAVLEEVVPGGNREHGDSDVGEMRLD